MIQRLRRERLLIRGFVELSIDEASKEHGILAVLGDDEPPAGFAAALHRAISDKIVDIWLSFCV